MTGGVIVTNLNQRILELKERRKTYGVSQNKLATSVGISRQYLSEIETEKVIPSSNLLAELDDMLERFNPITTRNVI